MLKTRDAIPHPSPPALLATPQLQHARDHVLALGSKHGVAPGQERQGHF
jgi:hypothetical protein